MLFLSILCFIIAALLGMYLLSFVLQNKETPKGISFIHGPLATTGLILLIAYACFNSPAPIVSIILFVFATLGGFFLILKDLTGKAIPKFLAIGHGLIAITAFGFLLMFTFIS